jgi:GT2 family glycosyltransferase
MKKITIHFRRLVHGMIVLLPQDFRTFLNQSNILTRLFLFFDKARYLPFDDSRPDMTAQHALHIPMTEYAYSEPEFTPDIEKELAEFPFRPLISIIVPVFDVNPKWLKAAVQSIENQWYERWELCLCDDHSSNPKTLEYLEAIRHPKIKVKRLPENLGISAASNGALTLAEGDFVALMDHDDELTVDALFEVVKAVNEQDADFLYSDEDKLKMDGTFGEPHFKPDFSPDMVLSQNYLSHLGVIRKSLVDRLGGFTIGMEGAQDYDLYLRVLEQTDKVTHISKVLYHWRKVPGSTAAVFDNKSYAQDAGARSLDAAVQRRKLSAEVHNGNRAGTYQLTYAIESEPLVSIIIPFKDEPKLLGKCIRSILKKSSYNHFEIIGISNNSEQKDTFALMKRLKAKDSRVSFHEYNVPFNFSEINNHAVSRYARGDHILLLNNDIEIISPEWLESLLQFSQRPDVGVVGGRLYYPDGRLQHAGIILGIGGVAGHSHKYFGRDHHGYFYRPHIVQNLSAVTAACCMVKSSIYKEVGGLDAEHLSIAFNDVDFCLRVREAGYLNVYTPFVEAWHHESVSRGYESTPEKQSRFEREVRYMLERHAEILEAGDPYYNRHLTLDHEDFSLRPEWTGQSDEI